MYTWAVVKRGISKNCFYKHKLTRQKTKSNKESARTWWIRWWYYRYLQVQNYWALYHTTVQHTISQQRVSSWVCCLLLQGLQNWYIWKNRCSTRSSHFSLWHNFTTFFFTIHGDKKLNFLGMNRLACLNSMNLVLKL